MSPWMLAAYLLVGAWGLVCALVACLTVRWWLGERIAGKQLVADTERFLATQTGRRQ